MKGNVYCIYHNNEICYVGSTQRPLKTRWNEYRSSHNNPNHPSYTMKIHIMMREHGFSNFKMELLEIVDVTDRNELCSIEDGWINSFKELGFELYNTKDARCDYDKRRQKTLARNNQKIPCPLCGKVIGRGHMARHQRQSNCIKPNLQQLLLH